MPELPEVETTRRGIEPLLQGRHIYKVIVRQRHLRWPIPDILVQSLAGHPIDSVERRGKYLLINTPAGSAILHLGMSGSLRIIDAHLPAQRHDHVDIVLDNHKALRLRDPRRFGALLWGGQTPLEHPLLKNLGPEPLSKSFDGTTLYEKSRGRKVAVKEFIMNSRIVVGVGNIYANESLFVAGIHPKCSAGRVSRTRYETLATTITQILESAIAAGGTTLRDFVREDGQPGYFRNELKVYGQTGTPCPNCGLPIRRYIQAQRATYFCRQCQR